MDWSLIKFGNRWAQDIIYFSIKDIPPFKFITHDQIIKSIDEAFNVWQSHIPHVTFVKIDDYNIANIKISFELKEHGDGFPFGPGELAHGFPPMSDPLRNYDGLLHINRDMNWADHHKSGLFGMPIFGNRYDFKTQMIHEIGHTLGLDHSDILDSVMYFKYRGEKRELYSEDVERIRNLYKRNIQIV